MFIKKIFYIKNQEEGITMSKKSVSLVTLITFIIFSMSCTTTTEIVKVKSASTRKGKIVTIVGVQKTSGEYIEFHKDQPGRIHRNAIVGGLEKRKTVETVEIDRANIIEIIKKKGNDAEIICKDGRTYSAKSYRALEDKIVAEVYGGYRYISIPLSEVELVRIEKSNNELLATLVVGALLVALISSGEKAHADSCPFIYSFDGEKYIFDAEPFGGAICQGLKRTEWCELESIKEINGQYKILVTNELNETQYTDELKLVVVDHPKGVKVAPDESGKIYTISTPIIPTKVIDKEGKDLTAYFAKKDRIFWRSHYEEMKPDKKEDLRDEIIFEFPKSREAKKARLLVNANITLWGSQVAKRFLELRGSKLDEWYKEVNRFGPAFYRTMAWFFNEELYLLKIQMETEDGWKSKGTIFGGGPFISDDKSYALDISDVPGDILKIKLTPPVAFWMIDHLAVDYTEDLPVQVTEMEAMQAVDQNGLDVRELLANNDNNYLVMPKTGDRTELVFLAPSRFDGVERTIILKATGYYDIHLEVTGEPQIDIIERFHNEPGFTLQYAFKEYMKWKKEVKEKTMHK